VPNTHKTKRNTLTLSCTQVRTLQPRASQIERLAKKLGVDEAEDLIAEQKARMVAHEAADQELPREEVADQRQSRIQKLADQLHELKEGLPGSP